MQKHMFGRASVLWVALIAIAGLAVGAATSIYLKKPDEPASTGLADGFASARILPRARVITDFALTDMFGAPFNRDRLLGRWHVIFFGFTNCPDVCPLTLATLAQALEQKPALRDSLGTIFISVDPQRDAQDALKEYVSYFDPTFLGVTGEHLQLTALTRQLGTLYVVDPESAGGNQYTVDHGASLIIMNPAGAMVGDIPPPHEADALARDLERVIATF